MFESSARLKIRDGELDGFKQRVTEIVRQTDDLDSKPLRYDWFLSDDGTECEVREAFVDADALVAHQRNIGPAKAALFRDFVESHSMTFYGEPSPALTAMLDAMGVSFTQFSFFQGLESAVPQEVGV